MTNKSYSLYGKFLPRVQDFLFLILWVSALLQGHQMLSIDSDLGRHLTLGNYILENRTIPTRDLFSHTLPNQSRPPYEWLSQILFALVYRLLNLDGVILFAATVISLTFALIFQFANRRSGLPVTSFLITFIAAGAASIHWLPRPHIMTVLLLAIWVEQLERLRKVQSVRLFVFPLMMLLWANLHGGFVFGILAWSAYFAGWLVERWQKKAGNEAGNKFLIAGFSSLIATIITPDLWHNWEAVLNNRSSFILSRTVETMPPQFTDPAIIPFVFLLLLTLLLFIINWKALSASHIFLLAGLALMSLLMARNIPLFAVASVPILTQFMREPLSRFKAWAQIEERMSNSGSQSLGYAIPLIIVLVAVAFFATHYQKTRNPFFQFNPQVFPVQAVNWLEDHPQQGNMFNEFNWGGYLLYRTWPRQLVFVDSQSDFYGETPMREYEKIITAKGNWQNLLDEYEVAWVIIPVKAPLTTMLIGSDDWELLYQDEIAAIFKHK